MEAAASLVRKTRHTHWSRAECHGAIKEPVYGVGSELGEKERAYTGSNKQLSPGRNHASKTLDDTSVEAQTFEDLINTGTSFWVLLGLRIIY